MQLTGTVVRGRTTVNNNEIRIQDEKMAKEGKVGSRRSDV